MTDDKDFKHLVREEARRSGRPYTDVRAEMRPAAPVAAIGREEVHERFEAIVAAIETWVYGKHDTTRLVATALLVPGPVLLRGVPGNGMTALGQGVAAAIGGRLVSIDGRTGLDPGEVARWCSDDVVVISHFDGLEPAAQVAVIEAARAPAIILAKRHPIGERMPFPPDDDTRERFLFGLDLDYGDVDTELRIVNEVRDGGGATRRGGVIDISDLAAMRAAVASVEVPEDVRRFVVEAIAATRVDDSLVLGASTVATLALVNAAAAAAAAAGRERAAIDDVEGVLEAILAHRVVFRDDLDADVAGLVARVAAAAR